MNTYLLRITLLLLIVGITISCSDDFINVDPVGTALEENYYRNAEEAFNGLVAAYDPVGWTSFVPKTPCLNAASDDFFAGGGGPNDINEMQVWDDFTLDPVVGPQGDFWSRNYQGIFRTNILLQKLPDADMEEALRTRFTAEARFLRAYYYFDLVRYFKRLPLIVQPLSGSDLTSVTVSDQSAVYELIEGDLVFSRDNLPSTVDPTTEGGRATKGAAQALLGKVYLYQDKFNDAATELAVVNGTPGGVSTYGYELLDEYGDLFMVSNAFNTESIFEVSHNTTSQGNWDCVGCTEGNIMPIMVAPRGYVINNASIAPALVSGWSFNTITQSLIDEFVQGGIYDPRYNTTIVNIDSLADLGIVNYTEAHENTGYFLMKFAGKETDRTTDTTVPFELNFGTNEYEIRLADTYLLEAEALIRGGGSAARAQALLDAVRSRVGLSSVPATLDNIKIERRLELAGEGHRWFDLVRWGDAATVLASDGFQAGKHEFLPIPQSELDFSGNMLEQDPSY